MVVKVYDDCPALRYDSGHCAMHTLSLRRFVAPAALFAPQLGIILGSWRKPCLETAMLYIYSAKTLRAMLADAKQAVKLVDDSEVHNVQDMIDAITHELS